MKTSAFISYIGSPELVDGCIHQVSRKADIVHVRIHGATGEDYDVRFGGVHEMHANRPTGRQVYAVSEMLGHPPCRKFLFDSWDEDGQASLEIDAERVKISRIQSPITRSVTRGGRQATVVAR